MWTEIAQLASTQHQTTTEPVGLCRTQLWRHRTHPTVRARRPLPTVLHRSPKPHPLYPSAVEGMCITVSLPLRPLACQSLPRLHHTPLITICEITVVYKPPLFSISNSLIQDDRHETNKQMDKQTNPGQRTNKPTDSELAGRFPCSVRTCPHVRAHPHAHTLTLTGQVGHEVHERAAGPWSDSGASLCRSQEWRVLQLVD